MRELFISKHALQRAKERNGLQPVKVIEGSFTGIELYSAKDSDYCLAKLDNAKFLGKKKGCKLELITVVEDDYKIKIEKRTVNPKYFDHKERFLPEKISIVVRKEEGNYENWYIWWFYRM